MAAFNVTRTNHTGLTVSDIDGSIEFFRDVLGFKTTEVMVHKGGMVERLTGVDGAEVRIAFVDLPGHKIELLQYVKPDDRKVSDLRNCDTGAFHIALEVDDIEAAIEAVEPSGFVAYSEPQTVPEGPRKGNRNVYLRNPDGIAIEFQMSADQKS